MSFNGSRSLSLGGYFEQEESELDQRVLTAPPMFKGIENALKTYFSYSREA